MTPPPGLRSPPWRWFALSLLVGGLWAFGLLSLLSVGLFALPVALAATALVAPVLRWDRRVEEATMDASVAGYIAEIQPEHRPLFDRVHRLVAEACPDAQLTWSYNMPTFKLGRRRLHVAVWRHGVSLYGWKAAGDGGFGDRHPELVTGRGTIQLRSEDAADISDDEIRALARSVLQ